MTVDKSENKKKKPRPAAELLDIEDRIEKMKADFREIREGMKASGMETVDLATGTFLLYLGTLEGLAKKYRGQFEEQQMIKAAKDARERVRAEGGLKKTKH